ncbi:MAG: hypothetical protein V1799_14990 [bacterium]
MKEKKKQIVKCISIVGIRGDVVLRRLYSQNDYQQCVELQDETWGTGFNERVPASILMVNQKIGGITAGAFDREGSMLGFVFGMTGLIDGRPVHWSDMLAVRNEIRGSGLGKELKLYQRDLLLPLGIEEVYWTFDPLVARNAHMNLNKLGAEISEYVADMYPDDTNAELNRGLGMDRFIAVWKITSERVIKAIADPPSELQPDAGITPVNSLLEKGGRPVPMEMELPMVPRIYIEIPLDIQAAKRESSALVQQWRQTTRHAFLHYLTNGYHVQSFIRDLETNRRYYLLIADEAQQ